MGKTRGRPATYDYEALSVELFDELVKRPNGMTTEQIVGFLGVPSRKVASKVVTTLRLALGEGDTIAVPVVRKGQKHIYKLSGSLEDCQDWLMKRARYKAQLLKTDSATLRALVKGTDGRTLTGKVVRRMVTSAERLEEDLAAYLEEAV